MAAEDVPIERLNWCHGEAESFCFLLLSVHHRAEHNPAVAKGLQDHQ